MTQHVLASNGRQGVNNNNSNNKYTNSNSRPYHPHTHTHNQKKMARKSETMFGGRRQTIAISIAAGSSNNDNTRQQK